MTAEEFRSRLRPCPWCRKKDGLSFDVWGSSTPGSYRPYVYCNGCEASGPEVEVAYVNEELLYDAALEAWNAWGTEPGPVGSLTP